METIINFRLNDCEWNHSIDGVPFKIEGECDVSRCGAVCCRIMNWTGKVGNTCEYLDKDLLCSFHRRDIHCKPISCLLWPTKPIDIDKTNEIAERLGYDFRCHLKVVKV